MAETGLMIVRDVDLSPACCRLDYSVDGIVVVCTAFQNDRSDDHIALDEEDQYDQCISSCDNHVEPKHQAVDLH